MTSSQSGSAGGMGLKRLVFDSILGGYLFCLALMAVTGSGLEDLRDLGKSFQIFLGSLVIAGLASELLLRMGLRTLGDLVFADAKRQALPDLGPLWKKIWFWQLVVFLGATFYVGGVLTKASLVDLLDQDGFAGAVRLFNGLAQPNWEILPSAVIGIITTIFMAFLATTLAIPVAFVLSFMAAKNLMNGPIAFPIYLFLRTVFNVVRSVEALVWAIIFSVWVGIGPFAGMLALMIHSIASLTKQYSEIVETVSDGPIEGVRSTGANALQVLWFAIVPQVILPYISFTIYRWDINIRMATIIGLVGGGGIGTLLIQYQGQAMWSEVGTIIVVIASVVWLMDAASAYLREALK